MKTTQEATRDFLNSILVVISKHSSKNYGTLVFKNMKSALSRDFTFISFMKIGNNGIKIDDRINSIDMHKIRGLFNRIMGILGPDVLKLLIKEHLDSEDLKYMDKLGVRL